MQTIIKALTVPFPDLPKWLEKTLIWLVAGASAFMLGSSVGVFFQAMGW